MFINNNNYFGIESKEVDHLRERIIPHWDRDTNLGEITRNAAKYLMSTTDEPQIPKHILTKTSLEIIEKIKITSNTLAMMKPQKFNACWGHISTKDSMFRYMIIDGNLFVVHFYLYTDQEKQYQEAMNIMKNRLVGIDTEPEYKNLSPEAMSKVKDEYITEVMKKEARFIAYNVWCFSLGRDAKDYEINEHHVKFLQIFIFMHYTTPDVKIIPAGKKVGSKKHGHFNLTTNDVIVVDSNWNTTVIRTEGFSVDGHLRFQACGKNHEDRKLVWIEPFEKHGYIRNAKNIND